MLSQQELAALRAQLEQRLAALQGHAEHRRTATATVELDQTRTGRLSRMDALQGQAMAQATEARAGVEARRIVAALRRLDEGTYGDCLECEEPVALGRLQANPAVPVCINCARRAEES